MWYVIQRTSGKEQEVCLWINTYVDKACYKRCFVPLYEDVWRKEKIGHISIKKMFSNYLFIESDNPEAVYEELRKIPKLTRLLGSADNYARFFVPVAEEEEAFLSNILSDGIMRVSYIRLNKNRKPEMIIGPLQAYADSIVKLDLPHRRAVVVVKLLGEDRRIKFRLWLDEDPKLERIEKEKELRSGITDNNKKESSESIKIPDYGIGDYVINTSGLYGDEPLEVIRINPSKNSVTVMASLFDSKVQIEMRLEDVVASGDKEG